MQKLIIEGINGAGKTPMIDMLINTAEGYGLSADTYAPYHLVRDKIDEDDIYPLWAEHPHQAVNLLLETIAEIEADARDRNLDLLVFDRHWLTAYTQAEHTPQIVDWWGDNFEPTALLTSPIDHLLRLSERGYHHGWLQADALMRYLAVYETLYQKHIHRFVGRFTVSSSTQDLTPIARTLAEMTLTQGETT